MGSIVCSQNFNIFFIIDFLMQTQKLLQAVGSQGKYQIYSIVFVCTKWLIISLCVFLPSYLLITPTFHCGSSTDVFKEVDACDLSQCTIDQPNTITNHANLYCGQLFTRQSIISAEFVGSVTGLVLLSMLADKLGRKLIIVSTLMISAAGTVALTLGANFIIYPLIYLGIIMMGFGGYSLSMVSYSYLSEINSDIWRQRSLIMTYSFWALGEIMLYPIITFIHNWLYICIFIFIVPLTFLLLASFFLVETPQFLYANRRYDECLVALNRIAKINGKPLLESLGEIPEPTKQVLRIQDTFLKSKYLIPLIVLSLAQACNNGYYYTIQYSIDDYGYRFQVNMLVIGCLEFCSCFFTNFFCHKMKRKLWIVILMILSGSFGILVEFTDSQIADLLLIGAGRLFNTVGFALFSLISSETFPTQIRSTGLGISEAMSNLGNIGAPFLVTLAAYSSVKAIFIGGFLNLGGGASMLIVKETKKDKQLINSQQKDPLMPSS